MLAVNGYSRGVHLRVMGMLGNMCNINQPSLPTSFESVLASISVFMILSTLFHSINSPDNSPLSHSVLPHVLVLSTIGLFMKVSFSLDNTPSR